MTEQMSKSWSFFSVFVGAVILIVGLLTSTAIFGAWGLIGGFIVLICIVIVKSSLKMKRGGD